MLRAENVHAMLCRSMSQPTETPSLLPATERAFSSGERLVYIDGLRGAASLAVACYHITRYTPIATAARGFIPEFLQGIFDRGWVGVQVFFVISGFVIAYSVRNARVTPGYVANYALRRSLRLDPPYWTTIAFVLLLHAVLHLGLGWVSLLDEPEPLSPPLSWWLVLCHVLYIHKINGYDSLSAGFWTLCIEVQFYLLYVTSLGLAQSVGRLFPRRKSREASDSESQPGAWTPTGICLAVALGAFAVASLWVFSVDREKYENWLSFFFYLFFPGCAACWVLTRQVPAVVFWGYFALAVGRLWFVGGLESVGEMFELKAALVTALSILVLGRTGRLTTALNWHWLQYLGRISYSLYLIHFPVSHFICTAVDRWNNGPPSPAISAGVLLASLLASIACAHLLHVFVEAPSVRLANRFRPKP